MARKPAYVLAVVLVTGIASAAPPARSVPTYPGITTIGNNASCDIGTYPAATLLLPYFEVDVTKPVDRAANTLFTIVNTSRLPQIARVTLWTDYGYPAMWFNLYLTGYDAESLSLYDLIVFGRTPKSSNRAAVGNRSMLANPTILSYENCDNLGGDIPPDALREVQVMLTRGVLAATGCRIGNDHPIAIGYATVDVVNSCTMVSPLESAYYSQVLLFDNVLTGDYDRINPDRDSGNYAAANPLVHIKAVPEGGAAGSVTTTSLPYTFYDRFTPTRARHIDRRQPLPAMFAARFIEGGTSDFATDYSIWREGGERGAAACSVAASSSSMPYTSIIRFDEMENAMAAAAATATKPLVLPASMAASTTGSPFPPQIAYSVTGWMYLNLDNHAAFTSAANPYSTTRASQNWVTVHMRAEGRYAVDFDATMLGNGCTAVSTGEVK